MKTLCLYHECTRYKSLCMQDMQDPANQGGQLHHQGSGAPQPPPRPSYDPPPRTSYDPTPRPSYDPPPRPSYDPPPRPSYDPSPRPSHDPPFDPPSGQAVQYAAPHPSARPPFNTPLNNPLAYSGAPTPPPVDLHYVNPSQRDFYAPSVDPVHGVNVLGVNGSGMGGSGMGTVPARDVASNRTNSSFQSSHNDHAPGTSSSPSPNDQAPGNVQMRMHAVPSKSNHDQNPSLNNFYGPGPAPGIGMKPLSSEHQEVPLVSNTPSTCAPHQLPIPQPESANARSEGTEAATISENTQSQIGHNGSNSSNRDRTLPRERRQFQVSGEREKHGGNASIRTYDSLGGMCFTLLLYHQIEEFF